MPGKKNTPLRVKTDSGFYAFNKTQAFLRFSLCKEALSQNKRFILRYKHVYQAGVTPEFFAVDKFIDNDVFDAIYQQIDTLGWGSRFYNYDKQVCVEGSFYPFIRYSGRKVKNVVDQGCIWIGGRSVYPRIYVDNSYCRWFKPIDKAGNIRLKPFLPLSDIQQELSKLRNQKIIDSLESD
jgi:hypothetical protein